MKNSIFTKISSLFKKGEDKHDCDNYVETTATDEVERCAMCGGPTSTPISMPIEWREDYEVGIGQVCIECRKKLRLEEERENMLSNSQISMMAEHPNK